jgi:hypothetical protein
MILFVTSGVSKTRVDCAIRLVKPMTLGVTAGLAIVKHNKQPVSPLTSSRPHTHDDLRDEWGSAERTLRIGGDVAGVCYLRIERIGVV